MTDSPPAARLGLGATFSHATIHAVGAVVGEEARLARRPGNRARAAASQPQGSRAGQGKLGKQRQAKAERGKLARTLRNSRGGLSGLYPIAALQCSSTTSCQVSDHTR